MKWKRIVLLVIVLLLLALFAEFFYKACIDSGRFEYDLERQTFISRSGWDAVGLGLYISNCDSVEDSYLIKRKDDSRASHPSLRLDSIPADYTVSCMGGFGLEASRLEDRVRRTRRITLLPNSRYELVRPRGCMASAYIHVRTDARGRVVEVSDATLRSGSPCQQ